MLLSLPDYKHFSVKEFHISLYLVLCFFHSLLVMKIYVKINFPGIVLYFLLNCFNIFIHKHFWFTKFYETTKIVIGI